MEFIDFKRAVYKQFDALANNADRLYLTNVNKDELWDCYIDSYPEDERQSHTCNCCRQFIKPYATVARNLAQLVKSKPVCDVFVSKVVKLGTDKNNVWIETPTRHVHTWNHLFYKLPNHLLCVVSDSEEAVRGALRINKTVLKRALDELSMDAFDIVLDLISQGSLYRGDQYKSDLEAFVALKKKYELLVDISNGRELKFNIVKHIIDVKLQEQEERIVAAEKKAKRQKILDLMAKKQDAELESKSYEELAKELEALS